jgi:hypothetical protein
MRQTGLVPWRTPFLKVPVPSDEWRNGAEWGGMGGGMGGRPDLRDFPLLLKQINQAGQAVLLSPLCLKRGARRPLWRGRPWGSCRLQNPEVERTLMRHRAGHRPL